MLYVIQDSAGMPVFVCTSLDSAKKYNPEDNWMSGKYTYTIVDDYDLN